MNENKQVASSVFEDIFSRPENFLSLYNALSDQNLKLEETKIVPCKLNDSIYKGLINDVSMEINGKVVVLIEHQSTINENMPLRCLLYIARIYEQIIPTRMRYHKSLQKIPAPDFYVLYNGISPIAEKTELRLSSAFEEGFTTSRLELIVPVISIKPNQNLPVQKKCNILEEYSAFIEKFHQFREETDSLEQGISLALEYCRKHNILTGYLKEAASEVFNMLTAYNYEEDIAVQREEAMEQGRAEGLAKGIAEGLSKGLAEGHSKGLAEGHSKGLSEGRSKGLAEGHAEALDASIKNLLAANAGTPEQISAWLKAPLEHVLELQSTL